MRAKLIKLFTRKEINEMFVKQKQVSTYTIYYYTTLSYFLSLCSTSLFLPNVEVPKIQNSGLQSDQKLHPIRKSRHPERDKSVRTECFFSLRETLSLL